MTDSSIDAFQPLMCGGSTCLADQTCVDSKCTFACTGNNVPGDYATLQGAITALAAAGQDATICVGAVDLPESGALTIADSANHSKALTIIGLSPERSRITARVEIQNGWSSVTLRGLGFAPPSPYTAIASYAQNTAIALLGSKLTAENGLAIYEKQSWKIEATEIDANNDKAVMAYTHVNGPIELKIANSYVHGASNIGVYTLGTGQEVHLELINNTLIGQQEGVQLGGSTTATIVNNLFTGMTVDAMSWTAGTTVTRNNNALWNNAANYSGIASDGPNTLKVDCMLGAEAVPQLGAGSPCLGAGDATVAPTRDFYGTPRGAAPDLGAVESP